MRWIPMLSLASAALFARSAHADGFASSPELRRAVAELEAAKGPEAYAALHGVWRTWDRADPAQVEAALEVFANDKATPPPAKVYADLLIAYARRRRGDLDGAAARVKALGFVSRWMVTGPFDNDGKGGLARAEEPELELDQPIDLGKTFQGKERPVRTRVLPEGNAFGWFDFGEYVRPRENVCAYATTFVKAKNGTKPRDASLWIGASGAFEVFWGTEKVLEDASYRDLDADRFAVAVKLDARWTRLTVKVCGEEEAPKFSLRIGDDRGAPDTLVDIDADPTLAAAVPRLDGGKKKLEGAKKNLEGSNLQIEGSKKKIEGFKKKIGAVKKKPWSGKLLGPLQQFENEVSVDKPRPEVLEAYARYLAHTGGDAHAEHQARDLARRAELAAPTIARALLAAELAEDRNQARAFLDRAKELKGGKDDLDVLFAEAQLLQSGTNWRDAVPVYQRMLAIDADNVNATLGIAGLYAEAGLKRTALATLESAVTKQPSSVALLRALAQELRAVGRDVEADEVEGRYAALRFDDAGFLSAKIDLAIARRDEAGATHWLGRFLASEPDGTYAESVAARAYRALGKSDRAMAALKRALAFSPEDVPTLRALADLAGERDQKEEQLRLLRQILVVTPQAKDVREYVEHIEPPKPKLDETYAWPSEKFLALRDAPNKGYPRRTLRSLSVSTVYPNGLSSKFRQIVTQPLTEEAAAQARETAFTYQADHQTVQIRAARVYRADGKVVESIETGETGANDPAINMYTSTRVVYVHFPRVMPGDVVELRYRVDDIGQKNDIADYFGEIEPLGSDEPVMNSEVVFIAPKSKQFEVGVKSFVPGSIQRETKEEGDTKFLRLFAAEIDPRSPEPHMPPWPEVVPYVHVSTFKSWDDIGTWYWGLAKDSFDVDDEVRAVVKRVTKDAKTPEDKVRAIYKYATEERYVALEFGLEGIRPRRCALTVARGWGDCKDKATLIVTMLREVGIPATIVLVRTDLKGDIEPAPPSLAPFDHAIAYVPSLDLYLDGTAEHSGTTELPVMDRGAFALQINEGKPKLVHLPDPPPDASKTTRKLEISVANDGGATFAEDIVVTGAYAPEWRMRLLAEGTRRERATRSLANELGGVDLLAGKSGLEMSDLDDAEQPVHMKAKGKAKTLVRKDGANLSVPAMSSHSLVSEYAPLSTRALDLVVGALTSREEEWTIKIPSGMKVVRGVTASKSDTPFGAFSISSEESGGKVVVKTSLSLKKSRVAPSEYAAFRAFCEDVDRSFGQRVVFGK